MEFYCVDDKLSLCHVCVIDDHKPHNIVSVYKYTDGLRNELLKSLLPLQNVQSVEFVEKKLTETKKGKEAELKKLEEQIVLLRGEISKCGVEIAEVKQQQDKTKTSNIVLQKSIQEISVFELMDQTKVNLLKKRIAETIKHLGIQPPSSNIPPSPPSSNIPLSTIPSTLRPKIADVGGEGAGVQQCLVISHVNGKAFALPTGSNGWIFVQQGGTIRALSTISSPETCGGINVNGKDMTTFSDFGPWKHTQDNSWFCFRNSSIIAYSVKFNESHAIYSCNETKFQLW